MTEQGYTETKTTTLKMAEPYKIKLVPYAKGYKIELTLNGDEYLADLMKIKEGPIVALITEAKILIKDQLQSVMLKDEEK